MRSRPEFVAQVEAVTGTETTFAEMMEKSVKCTLWLREQAVQSGDNIIDICTHLESYIPLLAALYIDAISNPWDNELSPSTLLILPLFQLVPVFFASSKPPNKIGFPFTESCVSKFIKENNLNTKLVVFGKLAGFEDASLMSILRSQDMGINEFECVKLSSPDHVATIICLSGISGLPKGTEISHAFMINYMAHVKIHDLRGYVDAFYTVIYSSLDCSKRIIVPDCDEIDEICRFIEKYEASVSWFRCDSCFPIRLVKFGILSKYSLPTLKILLFGDAHFRGELQQSLVKLLPHTNVILSYMTDYGGLCARQTKHSKPGSCGFVCETRRLKVVNPDMGKVLGVNKTGEIWAKSSYMMNGYYNNSEVTENAIDSDAVLEVAVMAVPHDVEEEHAMAFIAKVLGKEATELDITNLVEQNMPWYCRLHAGVKFMQRLLRTAKILIASVKSLSRCILAFLQYIPSFRIEDNILIGAEQTHPKCTNIGELVLDRLRNKPDFVGQIEIASEKQSTYTEMKEQNIKCSVIKKAWHSKRIRVVLTDILQDQVNLSEIDEFRCIIVDNLHDITMTCASSGTMGMPKGVELSYVSLYNSIIPIEEVYIINEVILSMPMIRWHYGLILMFDLVMSNVKWIITSAEVAFKDETKICKIIQDYGVTWLGADISFPYILFKYNILQKYSMPFLKKLVIISGLFLKKIQEAIAKMMPHTQILNCLTDAGGLCVSQTKNSKLGSCGFVTKGLKIKIVDEQTGQALGSNKTGKLCIKSEFIMNGYYKNPEETKNVIDSNGYWLHTKDIMDYDEEGEIYFVSRLSDFINYRSIKLSPAEIESILEIHPSVLKAAVVPVPHETDIEQPMTFIQKVIGKEVTEKELHDLVANNLPDYCKLIGGIKFVDKLLRLTTGKIDKKQLKLLTKSYITNVIRLKVNVKKKLHYHDAIREFRIEDNILTGKEIPINREPVNISEVLLKTLKSKPNCIGQVDALSGEQDTYANMSERSIKCALWLQKQGVKPGDIIGLCCDNDMNAIIILLGTMYIGAISNPWDNELSPMTARYFLSLTSPKIVFAMPSLVPILEEAMKELQINMKIVVSHKLNGYTSVEDILSGHDINEIIEFKCAKISSPDDVALLSLSSGTTGMPKATEISHSSLYNCLLPEKVTELEGHTGLWTHTLRWHYGVQLAFHAILAYSTKILAPCSIILNDDDEAICRFIEKYRVTWFSTEPGMLIRFYKSDLLEKYKLLTLKEVMSTGANLGKEHQIALAKKLPHAFITTGYGIRSTDAGADVTVMIKSCKPGSIGFVAPNVRIKVTDVETGKTLGANQNGELRLKLPCIMNGYYKRPEETERAFDSEGWLLSGDIGYYDEDGNVFLIDRISQFIIFHGINISTAEIENVLKTHPAVSQVAVIGIPHEIAGQHPKAVVSRMPHKTVTEEELHDLVAKNLPEYCKLRGGVTFLDKLPRTATGKIAKKQLRNMFNFSCRKISMKNISKNVYLRSVKTNNKICDSPLYISNIVKCTLFRYYFLQKRYPLSTRSIIIFLQKEYVEESKFKVRIIDNILLGPEYPIHRESVNTAETILQTLKSKPDCIGQIDAITDKQTTYAEMSERSIKCALWLKKQGVKSGDIISVCTDNNLDAIIVLLGIMYLNGKCNTWDHTLSLMTARNFLSMMTPTIIFTIPLSAANLTEAAKELKMNVKIVIFGKLDGYESIDDILKGHDNHEIFEFKCTPISNPDEVGIIVLTSGTTGMPKCTELSHSSLNNCLLPANIAEMKDHVCIFTPTIRWQYGIMLAFKIILTYSTRIIVPDYAIDDNTSNMYKFIEKYRVTWLATDPFILIEMVKTNILEKYRLTTLKVIVTAGSIFPRQYQETLIKKLPKAFIKNCYGSTDSGGSLSCQNKDSKPGSVGFPLPNVQIKVTDTETEEVLGINKVGELRIKVPSVMNGYYKNPKATKEAFDSDGWLCSGDLGFYDDDGEIFITSRISDFILFRAINVLPSEIEAVLQTHPAIFQVAVIGMPHEIDEQHPMAIVSIIPGKTVTEQELISLVETNLPDHCRIRAGVKFVDELPRTATGKIAKRQLQSMFMN
ncbi:LUCI monooxygenase, partial [Acromyrmex charruanus]